MSYSWPYQLSALPTSRDRADRALTDATTTYARGGEGSEAEWANAQAQLSVGYALMALRDQLERIGDVIEQSDNGQLDLARPARPGLLRRMAGWLR